MATLSQQTVDASKVNSLNGAKTATTAAALAFARPTSSSLFARADNATQPQNATSGFKSSPYTLSLDFSSDPKHDSALAPQVSNAMDGKLPKNPGLSNATAGIPSIIVHQEVGTLSPSGKGDIKSAERSRIPSDMKSATTATNPPVQFPGLTTEIPSGDLEDPFSSADLEFSKRGSVLWGGEKAFGRDGVLSTVSYPAHRRKLSREEHRLSRRIRSMYEHGDEAGADWDEEPDSISGDIRSAEARRDQARANALSALGDGRADEADGVRSASALSYNRGSIRREPNESAGGMEDWRDVRGGEVDRYGFISPKSPGSRASGHAKLNPPAGDQQRTRRSPNLLSAVEEDRQMTAEDGRPVSTAHSNRASIQNSESNYKLNRQTLRASPSVMSNRSRRSSTSILGSRRSPHNKGRRWMDDASDMLALPPGFTDVSQYQDREKAALVERRREVKWSKMARIVNKGPKSGGMNFSFDTSDAKLISRTWKGIPDRWRPTAWYSFLATSAKRRKGSPSEDELIEAFNSLQELNCADDPQIDMDVPRTISGHILFRRRYRGGQRSLFRTLHAISLYFPDTGYVQGMASLAATLLCYYDEERAFVMLVRLWQLRGLEYLYQEGFPGLIEALGEFEKRWLAGRVVAKQMKDLGISSTAFGTKWYLTLFNYSIPFTAQLRVWDVMMLLGDSMPSQGSKKPNLDVLHAASAALLDGLQEILLDSDFENAMKVLTAPVAVGKEDKLMKIAKHEWKEHHRS